MEMIETLPFSREFKAVFSEATDIARQANKPVDSAYLVLATFTIPCEAQSILLEKRINYEKVISSLRDIPPEPPRYHRPYLFYILTDCK